MIFRTSCGIEILFETGTEPPQRGSHQVIAGVMAFSFMEIRSQ
jgi:hypothetical protein